MGYGAPELLRHPAPAAVRDRIMSAIDFPTRLSRELARILPLTPRECRPDDQFALRRLRLRLEAALARESARAARGDWTYQRPRHAQLRRLYFEVVRLAELAGRADRPDGSDDRNCDPRKKR